MAVVNNNLSSIVGFQLTNSFRNENPQFVKFLESYYQFLESIQLHFETSNGVFTEGETVTGATSGATAKILSIDNRNIDKWRIQQFNRNRDKEDQVSTIDELEKKILELETELYYCHRNKKIEDEVQKRK